MITMPFCGLAKALGREAHVDELGILHLDPVGSGDRS